MNTATNTHNIIDGQANADLRSHDAQIALAKKMRLDDLRSQKSGTRLPGADKLLDRVLQEIRRQGVTVPAKGLISSSHLRRFLPKSLAGYEVSFVDLDKNVEPFLRSYLVRLAAVKTTFNLKEQLTEAEAKAALRVYYEFNDPYGEIVDLIPQFAIVHEIAEREANTRPVHDIDDYFAFAPWKSGANKDLYWFAIIHLKAIPPQLRLICPFIPAPEPTASLTGEPEPNPFDAYLVQVGAHVHLGMPYVLNYSTPFGSGKNPKDTRYMVMFWDLSDLINKSPEECRDLCGWKSAIRTAITDDFSKTVKEITSDKEEVRN